MNWSLITMVIMLLGTTDASLSKSPLKSRSNQNFGCNCLINRYLESELNLGLEYLNASNYMLHDSVAMRGFGKMYKSFWKNQLENANTMRKYMILRGGIVETPSYKAKITKDHFANVTSILHNFLELEKDLNKDLLELHKCAGINTYGEVLSVEKQCRNNLMRKRVLYDQLGFTEIVDPETASFLDANFLSAKVNRLKLIADMLEDLERLHRYHNNKDGILIDYGLNPIGVHLIDYELENTY